MNFEEHAVGRGLTNHGDGVFTYADRYCDVLYTYLKTGQVPAFPERSITNLALFTRPPVADGNGSREFSHVAIVSDLYKFEGNDAINESVRNSINQIGTPILREEAMLAHDFSQMRNSIIIQNPANVPEVGDVYPQIIVSNSYNGTKAKSVAFGLNMITRDDISVNFAFRTHLGELKQVHHENHQASIISPIGTFLDKFAGLYSELIHNAFNAPLSDEDVMATLDDIETLGKKRRKDISAMLHSMSDPSNPMTAWKMFLSITKFSTVERNLNIKKLMENAAERVLVLPTEMLKAARGS